MRQIYKLSEDLYVRIDEEIITITQDDWKKSGNFKEVFITKEQLTKILELSENMECK